VGSSSPLSAMGQGKRWKGLGRLHPYTKLMNYGSSVLFTMFNSPMPDELLKIFLNVVFMKRTITSLQSPEARSQRHRKSE
jgi:hypothetical protein